MTKIFLSWESGVDSNIAMWLPHFFAIAYNFLGNSADAEDAVQESMCKYLDKRPRLAQPEQLRCYLGKMVANHCLDVLRKRKRRFSSLDGEDVAAKDFAEESDHELGEWMAMLAPKDRLVLDLFYREELSLREISEILGDSLAAVKVRLHRARNELREVARQEGGNDGR